MKKILFSTALLASCIITMAQRPATDISRKFLQDSLNSYIELAMKQWQIPGVSVAVVKDDQVLYIKGFGVRESGKTEQVNEHTRFAIGSNTKAFTATALAMLQSQKKLSLDDKVIKWIPDFKVFDPWITKEANLRDLLCHRLGYETFQGDFMFFDSDLSYAEVKEKFGRINPLHEFRSHWGYCNAAFALAGEVIEKASGMPWGSYLADNIFRPLGMSETLPYSKQVDTATNVAAAHTVANGKLRRIPFGRIDNLAPAGSILSSASDMSKWVRALLNTDKAGNQLIPADAINATRLPHSILGNGGHPFNRAHFYLYGLGWFLQEYEGRKLVEHTGGVNGFVTSVSLVPEENLGIIVLTNTDANGFYEALKWEIMDALFGLPFRNYHQTTLQEYTGNEKRMDSLVKLRKDTIAMKIAPSLPLVAFTGNYEHGIYGKMNMAMENGKLTARFEHHKGRYATLEPLGGSRFLATFNDPLYGIRTWPFTINEGKVQSVTVTVSGFVEYTPYEFIKTP
ncbi:serine hydrolase [Flavihumibacter solisilvae]|uniref:Beta-lactamase n=1 Tax=Flavihumibacter solisilvae TaxID=1349421 RepID=A0A0C1J101_9BACT|nr:serine hydrolase [Flavihumibacter solisilvae]KIC96454.1 hypothetical protein OI18_01605 [Flavihumibacter solisilvae]